MWVHPYVSEKLRELEEDRLARARIAALRRTISRRPTATGRLAAIAGRILRRIGESLELWATPANERTRLGAEWASAAQRHGRVASRRTR